MRTFDFIHGFQPEEDITELDGSRGWTSAHHPDRGRRAAALRRQLVRSSPGDSDGDGP